MNSTLERYLSIQDISNDGHDYCSDLLKCMLMFKKKKGKAKENVLSYNKQCKKGPTIQPACEQIRVKTLPCPEFKLPPRLPQLHKQSSQSKKNMSRKTTSRTLRMDNSLRPSHLKNLLKQVNALKLDMLNPKSKSPLETRSRSAKKHQAPKQHLKDRFQKRFSLKIQNRVNKLNLCQLLQEEQDNIIYPSASTRPPERRHISNVSEIQGVDIQEMQSFQSKDHTGRLKVQIKSGDSLQQTIAAITIQRAWRRYCTKQLVQRYANWEYPVSLNSQVLNNLCSFQQNSENSMMVVPSQDFYRDGVEDVQQISNLGSNSAQEAEELEEMVKTIKMQELEKWNNILDMIKATQGKTQAERETIFAQIARQSEINRQNLLQMTQKTEEAKINKQIVKNEKIQHQSQEKETVKVDFRMKNHTQSESDSNYYNSKKYIEYLDGDVYIDDQSSNSSNKIRKALGITTISTKKQDMLLEALYARPVRLIQPRHCSALSQSNLHNPVIKDEPQAARKQATIRRSTSERILRRTLSDLNEQHSEIDIKIVQDEYLQRYPILHEDSQEAPFDNHSPNFRGQLREEQKLDSPPVHSQINTLKKQVENLLQGVPSISKEQTESISIDSDDEDFREVLNAKVDAVTQIVLNALAMDFLKEVTDSQYLTKSIRQYSFSQRPKIRKSENNRKKKGFPTDKKQIESFLNNLVNHLQEHEMTTLKNLQVSTGPSAIQMLKFMHVVDDESLDGHNSDSEQANVMVIPNRVFDTIWKQKEQGIVVEVPASFSQENSVAFKQNIEYLKSFNKIFYRALFDTFNECLDCQRNYGIIGQPFPWKKTSLFKHVISNEQIKEILNKTRKKMIGISTTYCGLIVETEELSQNLENQEYLQQVQEDRLSRMLASDLLQNEVRWQFYDDQEAEILIEISNLLYREIIFEILEELMSFND